MSNRERYEVLVDNHTHEGRALSKGDQIEIAERVAARYPEIFKRVGGDRPRATAAKSRGSTNDAPAAEPKE